MKNRRKKILAGSLTLAVLFSLLLSSYETKAEENESVLKSSEIKSTGHIQGMDGFYFDGADIQNLADDMSVLYITISASGTVLADEDASIKSWGNLNCENEIEFYSSDLVSINHSIKEMQQMISEGRSQIVTSLNTRGVSTDNNAAFSSMPESIAAVEQQVYIGVQKIPAEIIYHYHNHEYDGERTDDTYNNAIFNSPGGCYTKEIYDANGILKGYAVGCGYVENQIVSADVVEKQ